VIGLVGPAGLGLRAERPRRSCGAEDLVGLGDVESVVAAAALAQPGHRHGAPPAFLGNGEGGAVAVVDRVDVDVAGVDRPVHREVVDAALGDDVDRLHHRARHEGEQLVAGAVVVTAGGVAELAGVEGVQHAVVAAHVDDLPAHGLAGGEAAVAAVEVGVVAAAAVGLAVGAAGDRALVELAAGVEALVGGLDEGAEHQRVGVEDVAQLVGAEVLGWIAGADAGFGGEGDVDDLVGLGLGRRLL